MSVHILVECPELIPTVRLGIIETLQPLSNKGLCEVRFVQTIKIQKKDIVWSDIVVGVRSCDALSLVILQEAKRAGRFIIYYLDDDLLNIPKDSMGWEFFHNPIIRKNLINCLGLCDVLWGVNRNIRDKYLRYTPKKRWIENKLPVLSAKAFEIPELNKETIKVLYAGSYDHTPLVREVLSSVVKRIAEEFSNTVEFTFIGADPGITGLRNVHYMRFIKPYEAYRKFMEENTFRIGLAPARVSSFYACKYYNKFVEYASIGAVGVYSNTEPYTQVVHNEKNGILCKNTIDSWYSGIKKLIIDPSLLSRCQTNIRDQLLKEFDPETVVNNLTAQCPELIRYKAGKGSSVKINMPGSLFHYYHRSRMIWSEKGIKGIPTILKKTGKTVATRVLHIRKDTE